MAPDKMVPDRQIPWRYVMKTHQLNPKPIKRALLLAVLVIILWVPLFAGQWNPLGSIYLPANNIIDIPSYTIPPAYVDGQIVLNLTSPDSTLAEEICTQYNLEINQYLPQLGLFLLQSVMPDIRNLADEIAAYPGVESAYPNYEVTPLQSVQGSHAIPEEGNLTDYLNQPSAIDLSLDEAHLISTGEGVIIGLIDGGIDYNHLAFEGMVRTGHDYVDNDTDAFDEPGGQNSGHGTFVAGVIHLMAPDAQIYSYRVSDISGQSDGYLVAEAILQAIQDGCDVINISLVTSTQHSAIELAIEFAKSHNILVVAAAGNYYHANPLYPASDPYVISVGAITQDNTLADFTNDAEYVDIFAPGVEIYGPYPQDEYAVWSGTSFSTPFVTGLAALLYSDVSNIAREWVVDAIINSADNMGTGHLVPPSGNLLVLNPLASLGVEVPMFAMILDLWNRGNVIEAELGMDPWQIYTLGACTGGASYIPYTIEICESASFVKSYWGDDYLPSSLLFNIDIAGLPIGTYQDTVFLHVDGAYNSPAILIYTLQVKEQLDPVPIYGFLTGADPFNPYKVFEGNQGPINQRIRLGAYKIINENQHVQVGGLPYTISFDQNPEFLEITEYLPLDLPPIYSNGLTEDRFYFNVNTSALAPGTYYDTVFAEIDGVIDNPNFEAFELEIWPSDTTWVNVAGPVPEDCDAYRDGLHYIFQFGDIEITSSRVDTLYFDVNYNGPSSDYNIDIHFKEYVSDLSVFDFIDMGGSNPFELPLTGLTNDTIRVIIDWSGHTHTSPGDYIRWYKVEVPESSNGWMVVDFRFAVVENTPTVSAADADTKLINNLGNYPNPFNPTTEFRFSLSRDEAVNLTVYNILGRNVITLIDGRLPAGEHSIIWNGKDAGGSKVSSGIYFYRIIAADYIDTKRMVMLK